MTNRRSHVPIIILTLALIFGDNFIAGKRGGGSRGSSGGSRGSSGGSRSSGSRGSSSSGGSSYSWGSSGSSGSHYHYNTYNTGSGYGSGGGGGGGLSAWQIVLIVLVCIFILVFVVYSCQSKGGCCETHDPSLDVDDEEIERLSKPHEAEYPYSIQTHRNTICWPTDYPAHPLPPSQRGDVGFRTSSTEKGPPLMPRDDMPMQDFSDNRRVQFNNSNNPSAPAPEYGSIPEHGFKPADR